MGKPQSEKLDQVNDHALLAECRRRGWGIAPPCLPNDFDPDAAWGDRVAAALETDLRFARDELLAGRGASALAMLERILFPRSPAFMAVQYDLASAYRDLVLRLASR